MLKLIFKLTLNFTETTPCMHALAGLTKLLPANLQEIENIYSTLLDTPLMAMSKKHLGSDISITRSYVMRENCC